MKQKKPTTTAVTVDTETLPTPDPKRADYRGDPMWNTRRLGMTYVLSFCALYLLLITGLASFTALSAEKIVALGGLTAAMGVIVGPIIVAWFVTAEYGRVKGVLGTTTRATTSVVDKGV